MENYQIFISYRRDGGDALAGRIADRLNSMGYCVFYDVESMRSGTFNTQIYDAIDKCEDVILVLSPNALDRCVNDGDWVRKEIIYALSKKKNIIPIMMRGFNFPDNLAGEINQIRYMEGLFASSEYFDAVISKLVMLLKSKVEHKKIVDEILYLTKQNNWSHSVQTSKSGMVFINYVVEGLSNVPKVRLNIIVDTDYYISVIARNIIECTHCDDQKIYELLSNINKKSFFAIFEISNSPNGSYIQARHNVHNSIINRAGVCLAMIDELATEVNKLYPEISKTINYI